MLLERASKTVVAVPVAYEVIEIRGCRVHGRFKCAPPGIRYRSGWQPGMPVSVVRRVQLRVAMMESALIGPIQQLGVDDTGICVQGDSLTQPVKVNACH